jgi:hypothetical protein
MANEPLTYLAELINLIELNLSQMKALKTGQNNSNKKSLIAPKNPEPFSGRFFRHCQIFYLSPISTFVHVSAVDKNPSR